MHLFAVGICRSYLQWEFANSYGAFGVGHKLPNI